MQDIDPAAVLVGVGTHIADRPSEGRLGSRATVVSPCQAATIPIIDAASGSQVIPSQSSDPSMSARSGQLGEGLRVKVPPLTAMPKRAVFVEQPVEPPAGQPAAAADQTRQLGHSGQPYGQGDSHDLAFGQPHHFITVKTPGYKFQFGNLNYGHTKHTVHGASI